MMKKLILAATILFACLLTHATTTKSAMTTAMNHLEVDFVILDNSSKKSFFYTTDLEYEPDDLTQDRPCIRGVVLDRISKELVDPTSDPKIEIYFPYSDTQIDGYIVINCAI